MNNFEKVKSLFEKKFSEKNNALILIPRPFHSEEACHSGRFLKE